MNLSLNSDIAFGYTNNAQKARVFTENWVLKQIYCPSCGNSMCEYINNKPVADFFCPLCVEDYELKSKKGTFGKKVSAGSYSKMIERINSLHKPNFFFMGYIAQEMEVSNFFVIPKHFFISDIIEKRKPLALSAKRAGWVGSNILFSKIPTAGHIFYIENGKKNSKKSVLEKWQKTLFLKNIKKNEAKGWILDIMNCIDCINKDIFSLNDIYAFESQLAQMHPDNKNIKPKMRQQLQILRDKNYIKFLGDGLYSIN